MDTVKKAILVAAFLLLGLSIGSVKADKFMGGTEKDGIGFKTGKVHIGFLSDGRLGSITVAGYPFYFEATTTREPQSTFVPGPGNVKVKTDRRDKKVVCWKGVLKEKTTGTILKDVDLEIEFKIKIDKGAARLFLESRLENSGLPAQFRGVWLLKNRQGFKDFKKCGKPFLNGGPVEWLNPASVFIGKVDWVWFPASRGKNTGLGIVTKEVVIWQDYGKRIAFSTRASTDLIFLEEGEILKQQLVVFPANSREETGRVYNSLK